MLECEICGSSGRLIETMVGGAKLRVCESCSEKGTVLEKKPEFLVYKKEKKIFKTIPTTSQRAMEKTAYFDLEPGETFLVENFGSRIKSAREKTGLTHEELGKQIKEHVSVIHNLETQKHKPTEILAKKIERFLKIKLYEEI